MAATVININELECWGRVMYRVYREDGIRFMDALQVDFDSEDEAKRCVAGELRRNKMGATVRVRHIDRQANGRRNLVNEYHVDNVWND